MKKMLLNTFTFSLNIILFLWSIFLILLAPSQLYSCMLLWFLSILSWRKLMTHATISADPFFAALCSAHTHTNHLDSITHTGELPWFFCEKIFFFSASADYMAVNVAMLALGHFYFLPLTPSLCPLLKYANHIPEKCSSDFLSLKPNPPLWEGRFPCHLNLPVLSPPSPTYCRIICYEIYCFTTVTHILGFTVVPLQAQYCYILDIF